MSTIYIVTIDLFEKNIILGWSKKEKLIQRYIDQSLHNLDLLTVSKVQFENIGEIFDCPFDIDTDSLNNDQIEKRSKHCLTSLEWKIIDDEFEKFLYTLQERLHPISIVKNALSDKGQSALKIVLNELTQIDKKELYKSFLDHHPFFNNKGCVDDLMERLIYRKSFQESKKMDDEYKQIISDDDRFFR